MVDVRPNLEGIRSLWYVFLEDVGRGQCSVVYKRAVSLFELTSMEAEPELYHASHMSLGYFSYGEVRSKLHPTCLRCLVCEFCGMALPKADRYSIRVDQVNENVRKGL